MKLGAIASRWEFGGDRSTLGVGAIARLRFLDFGQEYCVGLGFERWSMRTIGSALTTLLSRYHDFYNRAGIFRQSAQTGFMSEL